MTAKEGASRAIKPVQPNSLHAMSDADLADEHRGLGFAKRRAADRIKDIEAEIERRGIAGPVKGKLGMLERKPTTLLDLDRLRKERPDIVEAFALGGGTYFSSRTLTAEERRS